MSTDPRHWQWTDDQDSTLTRMWHANATLQDIADEIGCSWRQASDQRARLGLEQRPPGWQPKASERSWVGRPERPSVADPDKAFARAMAGRQFASLNVSPDPRRLYSTSVDAGMGASSMEINA